MKWKPGQSGNPKGRPKLEYSFTTILRTKAAQRPDLIDRLFALADSEDERVALQAIVTIANRLDGMPKQATEITGADGGPVVMKWDDGDDA